MDEPDELKSVSTRADSTRVRRAVEDPRSDHLFPLDLTPFEQYLLVDDQPVHPMVAFMQVVAATQMDTAKLEEALYRACQRNPLYASRVVRQPFIWQWHYDPEFRPRLCSIVDEPPVRHGQLVPIDLTRECGLRVWHDQQPDGRWRLLFQFHHACADGLGMRRYIIDVLVSYARLCSAEDDPLHSKLRMDRLDPNRLLSRGCLKHLTDTPPVVALTAWQRLVNTYYFFCQPPTPIRGTAHRGPADSPNHAPPHEPMIVRVLSAEDSEPILTRARESELGINDLGIAILFHRCRQWNDRCGLSGNRRRIRVLMPFDIRSRDDLRLSAANRISYSFLGRRHNQCMDWDKLLSSVQAEIRHIKDSRVYLDFIQGMALSQKKPRTFRWALHRMRNVATCVFTYGGDANRGLTRIFASDQQGYMRIGDTLIEDGIGTPPVRLNTNISIGFGINHGQVTIALAWNRKVLTYTEAQEFLQGYVLALQQWGRSGQVSPAADTSSGPIV